MYQITTYSICILSHIKHGIYDRVILMNEHLYASVSSLTWADGWYEHIFTVDLGKGTPAKCEGRQL